MQEILYIANARFPTEKAHGIQIAKMCEAFAQMGIKVTLWVPRRFQANPQLRFQDVYRYYGVKPIFSIEYLPNLDTLKKPLPVSALNTLSYVVQDASFALAATLKARMAKGILYSRSKLVAAMANQVIFEAHDSAKQTILDKLVAKRCRCIVVLTKSMDRSWQEMGARTIYAPDGVSPEFFSRMSTKKARQQLGLPLDKIIVLYAGNFYPWKGIDTLLAAAPNLPEVNFYLVGGSLVDRNLTATQKKARGLTNVKTIDHQPHPLMPIWIKTADVLVLPNTGKTRKSRKDASPLKLFEYMASGRPILASRLPSITEIVSEKEVTFFQADNPQDLAEKLKLILHNPQICQKKALLAQRKAREFTWKKRAEVILKGISGI